MLWNSWSVVSGWVRGRRLWKGDGLGIIWVDFGRQWWTGVMGIAEGKELGFSWSQVVFQRVIGWFRGVEWLGNVGGRRPGVG